jgi:8-oxo-dGTP pyrophosphatase MutT (NUDIX family)
MPTLAEDLAAYHAANDREAAMVERVRAFLAAHADAFERTQLAGHITASAWIVDEETHGFALLTHHRKLDRWLQLGGHTDGDTDVRRSALREAVEESGLASVRLARPQIYDVDVHEIPARGAEPAHFHYDIRFGFVADMSEPFVVSEESHDLAWRPITELDTDGVDESVRRMARKTAAFFEMSS